jgi:hypothetical protein
MSNKNLILTMGWVTLIVFPLVALLILKFVSGQWQFVFQNGIQIYFQIPIGIALGLILGYGLKAMLSTPGFKDLTHTYADMLSEFGLNPQEFTFLSVCAGVGEEILFRGCIQYYAGIYLTAVIFVALHGYLNPLNRKILLYGIVLSAIFIGVGFLMSYIGIYACIILHIIIDIILFGHLFSTAQNKIS